MRQPVDPSLARSRFRPTGAFFCEICDLSRLFPYLEICVRGCSSAVASRAFAARDFCWWRCYRTGSSGFAFSECGQGGL